MTGALKARLMLVAICLMWGLTWPAMRLGLVDFPPFTMRALSALIGAATMFVIAALAGRPVGVPPRQVWGYIFAVSFFNIILFALCVAYAQLHTMTGRVAIVVYTMPIWASVMSWFVLSERPNKHTIIAIALCAVGMAVLIYPLASTGIPLGIVLSLCAALSWAIGTIYVKKSHKDVEPFTLSAWQLILALVVMSVPAVTLESYNIFGASWKAWAGVAFSGLFGSAIAFYLWFHVIRVMPASTASLSSLSAPVIGLVSSIFLLGEIPTTNDVIGFALIFGASLCALLPSQGSAPRRASD